MKLIFHTGRGDPDLDSCKCNMYFYQLPLWLQCYCSCRHLYLYFYLSHQPVVHVYVLEYEYLMDQRKLSSNAENTTNVYQCEQSVRHLLKNCQSSKLAIVLLIRLHNATKLKYYLTFGSVSKSFCRNGCGHICLQSIFLCVMYTIVILTVDICCLWRSWIYVIIRLTAC